MQAAIRGFGVRIFGSPPARGDVEYPISISDFHSHLPVQNIPQPGPNFQIFKFQFRSISEPQCLYIRHFPIPTPFSNPDLCPLSKFDFDTPILTPIETDTTKSNVNLPGTVVKSAAASGGANVTDPFGSVTIDTCRSAFTFGTMPLALCHFALVVCHWLTRLTTLVVTLALS